MSVVLAVTKKVGQTVSYIHNPVSEIILA